MWQVSQQNNQTINKPTIYLKWITSVYKKQVMLNQIQTQDLCHPSRIDYLQTQ